LSKGKILVVEDENKITQVIKAYLERDGYEVLTTESGKQALSLATDAQPVLVILDLMLPDLPGEEVCKQLRANSDVSIIMVTAKTAEDNKIAGLEIGADDYITKPFSPRELLARVHTVLRRTYSDSLLAERLSFNNGKLEIDISRHLVTANGKQINLTASEFKLLTVLARHPGRVFSRLELVNKVQGYDFIGYERTIDAHVKNIRRKIEENSKSPRYIKTVFGVGYKFES
jgi:DNA-binding response OmpR family regulator